MSFIEIEKSVKKEKWSMMDLHSHPHYEIFFLVKGKRSYFLSNSLYNLSTPVIIIIPPHVMHKSEGDAFERYTLSVDERYLDKFQAHVLKQKALSVIELNEKDKNKFAHLFEKLCTVDKHKKYSDDVVRALASYLILEISELDSKNSTPSASAQNVVPALVLKVIDYLNANFGQRITLETLAEQFFVSKGALIYNFNKHVNCSPIDFLLNIRLTKAKEFLLNNNFGVEEIAERCGFSSANYFSLIFKKKEKISPLNYRKHERNKN